MDAFWVANLTICSLQFSPKTVLRPFKTHLCQNYGSNQMSTRSDEQSQKRPTFTGIALRLPESRYLYWGESVPFWLVGPIDPSFRALSGRRKFTVRRHHSNEDSLSLERKQRWGLQSFQGCQAFRCCGVTGAPSVGRLRRT